MPRTKFQDLVFTCIMVVIMVYCMTLYNLARETGLHYVTFLQALQFMWPEAVAAFFAQKYVAGPLARKQTFRLLQPGVDKQILITVSIAGFTVSMMAPIMTLFATLWHRGFIWDLPLIWLSNLIYNYPFALIIQIFYVGPLVRWIFRGLFRKQLMAPVKVEAAFR
jgi:hypothetical protein